MDPLEGLGDHRAHTQQAGAAAAQSRDDPIEPYSSAEHHQRDVLPRIVLRGVIDERLRAARLGEVAGVAAGHIVEELVAQPDVGEKVPRIITSVVAAP